MEGIWYLLLILALYLLPELLKKLRQQTKRYEYPPAPPAPPVQLEMEFKEEDAAAAANLEQESAIERMPVGAAAAVSGGLTPRTVLQGVIWAEILKPPLSKRRAGQRQARRS